jgi:hypothetical protein
VAEPSRAKLRAMFYDRAARRFPLVGTETELEARIERPDLISGGDDPAVAAILRLRERYVAWALARFDAGDSYDVESDEWLPGDR